MDKQVEKNVKLEILVYVDPISVWYIELLDGKMSKHKFTDGTRAEDL